MCDDAGGKKWKENNEIFSSEFLETKLIFIVKCRSMWLLNCCLIRIILSNENENENNKIIGNDVAKNILGISAVTNFGVYLKISNFLW